MFGIGFGELLLIALVCLLVFDPKDLPKIFQKIAQFYQNLTSLKQDISYKINFLDTKKKDDGNE